VAKRRPATLRDTFEFGPGPSEHPRVTGTVINAAAILAAIVLARLGAPAPDASGQLLARRFVAAAAAYAGVVGFWTALNGSPGAVARQALIALAALLLGNLTGRLARLQPLLDRCGTRLGPKLPRLAGTSSAEESWFALAVLFFLNPLTVPGTVQDGLQNQWPALAAKSCVDAISLLAYGRRLSVRGGLTLLVTTCGVQALIAMGMIRMEPWLARHELKDSVLAVAGLLVLASVPALAGIRKAKLANLVPSLVWAPILTAIGRA
jgi:uncharacterized membrane protein YqgA involved in biofilm formation